jgi:hypothetical protein
MQMAEEICAGVHLGPTLVPLKERFADGESAFIYTNRQFDRAELLFFDQHFGLTL